VLLSRASWHERGDRIVDRVLEAVERYCVEGYDGPVLKCVEEIGDDLYQVARDLYYAGYLAGVTEEDLRWLNSMPSDAYSWVNYVFRVSLNNIRVLVYYEVKKICSEVCSETEAEEEYVEQCVEQCIYELKWE
jgi:hypothetical protein